VLESAHACPPERRSRACLRHAGGASGGFRFLLLSSKYFITLVLINFAISMNLVSGSTILRRSRPFPKGGKAMSQRDSFGTFGRLLWSGKSYHLPADLSIDLSAEIICRRKRSAGGSAYGTQARGIAFRCICNGTDFLSALLAADKHALSLGGNCSVLLTGMPSVSR